MKKTLTLLSLLISFAASAQKDTIPRPTTLPLRFGNFYNWSPGYLRIDSGLMVNVRDTMWTPIRMGTLTFWQNTGTDTTLWEWDGVRWKTFGGSGGGGGTITDITGTDNYGFHPIISGTTTKNIQMSSLLDYGQIFYTGTAGAARGSDSLYWDSTNLRLGLHTVEPRATEEINGNLYVADTLTTNGDLYHDRVSQFYALATSNNGSADIFPRAYYSELKTAGSTNFGGSLTTVIAGQSQVKLDANVTVRESTGFMGRSWGTGDNTATTMQGVEGAVQSSTGITQTATDAAGVSGSLWHFGGTLTATNFYYLRSRDVISSLITENITNKYGLYIHNFTSGGGNNYGIYQAGSAKTNVFESATNKFPNLTNGSASDSILVINGATMKKVASASFGSGTVTSVATNTSTGITGGTITSTGTIAADTTLLSTRAWRQKGDDSLGAIKLNKTDTSYLGRNYIYLFGVGGQSNISGDQGNSTSGTPTVDGTYIMKYKDGAGITSGNDPVGNGSGSTPLPMFGLTYNKMTGRKILMVDAAVTGSGQTTQANASSNWQVSGGSLDDTLIARMNRAATAAATAGYTVLYGGILWCQGEVDGRKINDAAETQAQYQTALKGMIAEYRSNFTNIPFYIIRTGTNTNESDVGFDSIRQSQQYVSNYDSLTKIVVWETKDFPNTYKMKDTVHYNNEGNNVVGRLAAENIVAATGNVFQARNDDSSSSKSIYFLNGNVSINAYPQTEKFYVSGSSKYNGIGTYLDTLTATTMGTLDSSNRVASTAWVKRQGYSAGAGGGITSLNGLTGATQVFTSTGITITSATATHDFSNDFSTGKAGGLTAIGGTASGENLTLQSTANATKGIIYLGAAHESYFDEANKSILLVKTGIGASASTLGVELKNTTAASSGNPQYSPSLILTGNGYSTGSSASQAMNIRFYTETTSGSQPRGVLHIQAQTNAGGYSDLLTLNNSGTIQAQFAANMSAGSITGTTSVTTPIVAASASTLDFQTSSITLMRLKGTGGSVNIQRGGTQSTVGTPLFNIARSGTGGAGISSPTVAVTSGSATVTGTNTNFLEELRIGDNITISGTTKAITAIASNTSLTTSTTWGSTLSGQSYTYSTGTVFYAQNNGLIGINTSSPTSFLDLGAGTADYAAMRFTTGTDLTTGVDGAVNWDGSDLHIWDGTTKYTLDKSLTGSATLDFGSTSAQSSADLTITVTGAASGDVVLLGVPNGSITTNSSFSAWVSAADTVTVRYNNYSSGSQDPPSGTFKARVVK